MSQITESVRKHLLVMYTPDTRGVTMSRFGRGNLKIGLGVYTYSRLPGSPAHAALGAGRLYEERGTCPGATTECQAICYAARPVAEAGPVRDMWETNSQTETVPDELPPDCALLRIHVSGDFTSADYILRWRDLLLRYPHVKAWAYTRSWRVPELLPALETLRLLPNVQLFASMDSSTKELPPAGWRRAWIDGDERAGTPIGARAHEYITAKALIVQKTPDLVKTLICPEETKAQPDCETCRYCFDGKRNDVTFLKH